MKIFDHSVGDFEPSAFSGQLVTWPQVHTSSHRINLDACESAWRWSMPLFAALHQTLFFRECSYLPESDKEKYSTAFHTGVYRILTPLDWVKKFVMAKNLNPTHSVFLSFFLFFPSFYAGDVREIRLIVWSSGGILKIAFHPNMFFLFVLEIFKCREKSAPSALLFVVRCWHVKHGKLDTSFFT